MEIILQVNLGFCNYITCHCEPLLSLRLTCTTEHWTARLPELNLAVFAHEMLLAASSSQTISA